MNTIDDDFVEMISYLLVNGDAWFEEILVAYSRWHFDRGTTKDQPLQD